MKITKRFWKIYKDFVYLYIETKLERNACTEPIFYTLEQYSNRFRSATAVIVAEIFGIDVSKVLPIAAVSEILHTSTVIQDDIADNDMIRRGVPTAWKKFGIPYVCIVCFKLCDSSLCGTFE